MRFESMVASDILGYGCDPLVLIPAYNTMRNLASLRLYDDFPEMARAVLADLDQLLHRYCREFKGLDATEKALSILPQFSAKEMERIYGYFAGFLPKRTLEKGLMEQGYTSQRIVSPERYPDKEQRFEVCRKAVPRSLFTEDFLLTGKPGKQGPEDIDPADILRKHIHDFYYAKGLESCGEALVKDGTYRTLFVPWRRRKPIGNRVDYRTTVDVRVKAVNSREAVSVIDCMYACVKNHVITPDGDLVEQSSSGTAPSRARSI